MALSTRTPQGDGYVAVSVGWSHGCALREDGFVDCWSPADDQAAAASCCASGLQAPDLRFEHIDVGDFDNACGLDTDGLLWCWTSDDLVSYPELGIGTLAVAAGPCVLDHDGMVHCADGGSGAGPFTELRGRGRVRCGRRPDGHVECTTDTDEPYEEVADAGPFSTIAITRTPHWVPGLADITVCGIGQDQRIDCLALDPDLGSIIVPPEGEFERVTISLPWEYVPTVCGQTIEGHVVCGDDGAWGQGRVPDGL